MSFLLNFNRKLPVAYTRATEVQGKWPVIISWIVHQLFMVCYNFSDLFCYVIRLWNKEKKTKKKRYYFKKKKKGEKEKKSDMRPPGIEPVPNWFRLRHANHSAIDAYGLDPWSGLHI